MKIQNELPVAIIGAGPVGLAAAAHLTLRKIPFLLFEEGKSVGANILSWQHIRVFSPWKYNLDKAAVSLLEKSNWIKPDDEGLPTGKELYRSYFDPFSKLPEIEPHIFLDAKVKAVGRRNFDKIKTFGRESQPFVLQVEHKEKGVEFYEAKAVIDASGTWNNPNPIGSGGIFALGEIEHASRITYGIPQVLGKVRDRYKDKKVLVVGSGHSAINVLLELDELKKDHPKTEICWVLRKGKIEDVYGGRENDALEARGALGIKIERLIVEERINVYTPFDIEEIHAVGNKLYIVGKKNGEKRMLPEIDEIISNTGSRPDFSFLREIRLEIDPALESAEAIAELIDPNIHSCGTVRAHGEKELRHHEKDFYIVGSKSYGRAPTFLMATGYEQVRSIVASLGGDWEAARKVELDLPETGVCNSDGAVACCGSSSSKSHTVSCCS